MRAFVAVAATGVIGVFLLELLTALLTPLLGKILLAVFAFLALAFKIGLFLGIGFFVYRMFRRRQEQSRA